MNVTAVLVLSLNALRQPKAADAQDLDLVSGVLGRLASLEREEPESYLRPVRAVCEDVYNTARRVTAAAGHGSLRGNQIEPPRNVVASHVTTADHEVSAVAPGAHFRAAQQGVSAPSGPEIQSNLNGDPNVRLYDTGAVTWDQSMLDLWEFDSLLGEGHLTVIE